MPAVLTKLNFGGVARIRGLPGAIQPDEPERKEEAIAPANTIWSVTAAPDGSLGIVGDFALDATHSIIYGPKVADSSWPAGTSLLGAAGANGATGAPGIGPTTSTSTVALSTVGSSYTVPVGQGLSFPVGTYLTLSDGTHWIGGIVTAGGGTSGTPDTLTVFSVTQSGTSGTVATGAVVTFGSQGAVGATGATGATGSTGATGTTGTAGSTVLNGTSNPVDTQGANGDFFLNTTSLVLFGPKAAGAWPGGGTLLVGPEGPSGTLGTALSRSTATIASSGPDVTAAVTMGRVVLLLAIESTSPTRVRFYDTAAHATLDSSRTADTEAPMGSGCLYEFLSIAGFLGMSLNPVTQLYSNESTPSADLSYILEPTGGVATSVTLTYLVVQP